MNQILSRRGFLKLTTLAGAGLVIGPRLLFRTARAAENGESGPILVHVFQRGAMDGLSAVVPHADKEYYSFRSSIAIPPPKKGTKGTAVDLDGRFGLNPGLAPLAEDFRAKRLAIVHAVGSPSRSRSHFDAQAYMESGTPDSKAIPSGWMNRYLETNSRSGDGTFRAVSLTSTLPRTLRGDAPALAVASLGGFTVAGGSTLGSAIGAMYDRGRDDIVHDSGREAFDAVRKLKAANPTRFQPANGAEYPRGRFGDEMKAIAQIIKADLGLEAAFSELGGWDTHLNQGGAEGNLASRLTELGASLHAFATDLGDRMKDVVVVSLTEFGRTVRENGTGGTDHGHGSVSFVLGGKVKGGKVYGRWPGLKKDQLWQNRDLAVTTDFRDVLSEILADHLGAKHLDRIFPNYRPKPVGIL